MRYQKTQHTVFLRGMYEEKAQKINIASSYS